MSTSKHGCRPTCYLNGSPYHAFDCPNHPGVRRSTYRHATCTHCRHENEPTTTPSTEDRNRA